MFLTRTSYDPNEIAHIDEEQANKLYKRGVVDFLEDDEFVEDDKLVEEELDLEELTVPKLKEIAIKEGVSHSGLKKAELVKAIKEVK